MIASNVPRDCANPWFRSKIRHSAHIRQSRLFGSNTGEGDSLATQTLLLCSSAHTMNSKLEYPANNCPGFTHRFGRSSHQYRNSCIHILFTGWRPSQGLATSQRLLHSRSLKLTIFGSRKTLRGTPMLTEFFRLMDSRGWK